MSRNKWDRQQRKESNMVETPAADDLPPDFPELPVDEELPESVVVVPPPVVPTSFQQVPTMSKLELELDIYREKMSGKQTLEETAQVQYGFLRLLRGILSNQNQQEVNAQWNTMLNYANKNLSTVFNEYHLFRGAEAWVGSQAEFSLLRRLAWLILQTANVQTRRGKLPQISLERVADGMTAAERNSLINFYS